MTPEAAGFKGQQLMLVPHDIELTLQAALRRTEALDLARHIMESGRAVSAVGGKLESAAVSVVVEAAAIS